MTPFFIQDHQFVLPDPTLAGDAFTVRSCPRPYPVLFHANPDKKFMWLKKRVEQESSPIIFIDRHIREILSRYGAMPEAPAMEMEAEEPHKNIYTSLKLCDFLQEHNANRGSMLFVIGGGITQDVGATAAALFKRGLPWSLVPTTLLSQADSCIGSKTALNHGNAKNVLGLFYAPREVHIDLEFTDTLSQADLLSGLGEVLRLSITGGEASFSLFESEIDSALSGERTALTRLVHTALTVKTCIIEEDEYELDLRRAMNYAHTIGHAIEALSGYAIPHGVGIAIGLLVENTIAVEQGVLDFAIARRIAEQARKLIPQESWHIFSSLPLENLLPLLKNDKKAVGGLLKLALLKNIGRIIFTDLPLDEHGLDIIHSAAAQTLKTLFGEANGPCSAS